MTAYRPSPKLLEVLAYLREREIAGWAKAYNGVHADHAGDSSAATNRIDSVIPPSDRLSPGPGGGLRTIEGIVR